MEHCLAGEPKAFDAKSVREPDFQIDEPRHRRGDTQDDAPQAHERVEVAEDDTPRPLADVCGTACRTREGDTISSSGAGPHEAKAGQEARRCGRMPLVGVSPSMSA